MAETCGPCGHTFHRLELGSNVVEHADSTTLSTLQYMIKLQLGFIFADPRLVALIAPCLSLCNAYCDGFSL